MLASALLAALPAVASAQSDVTFTVPLNFTGLSSDIAKIAVYCYIESSALPPPKVPGTSNRVGNQEEYSVVGGKLVNERGASIVVPVTIDAPARPTPATYTCNVTGFSTSLNKWDVFSPTQATPAFKLSPASPQTLTGTFNW